MLDIKFIRENPEKVKEGLKKKRFDFDVAYLLGLDEKRRAKIKEVDDMRARQNQISDEISKLSANERQEKIEESRPAGARLAELIEAAKNIKEKLGHSEFELKVLDDEFTDLIYKIPNLPFDDVPVGGGEKDNVVLREVGKRPEFDFEPKDHLELGEALGIIDFETGAKVAGNGFYYLKNTGAALELALVQYAFDFFRKHNWILVLTPDVARKRFYLGTGYQPKGEEAQTYEIEGSDLGLIATAEITLAGMHADEIIDAEKLPIRYVGYSHCFRQEGGSYGKYSRGLYRVHQFSKVEMFVFAKPEESEAIHRELLELEEKLWQGLGIPYRVVEMCTGDLGAQAARKYDLEAWLPGRAAPEGRASQWRGDWGEVTSTTNTTDYQARNLSIRYRKENGEIGFVHTLNGTAIPLSRAPIAILENYQREDGSVEIPEVLRPYMGGLKEIRR